MSNIGIRTLTSTDVHEVTNYRTEVLGAIAITADGRKYRYAKAGATALVAGATVTAGTTPTASTGTTQDALKPNDSHVATGATVTAADAQAFENGVVTIDHRQYLVNGVTKNGVISLIDHIDQHIARGKATSLAKSPYSGVVAGGTNVLGTPEVAIPAGHYGWIRV